MSVRPASGRPSTHICQAVYNAQQLRHDPLEYDLLADSMIRLQEFFDIDSDGVQDLIDAEFLQHNSDHPHGLFSVTSEGRTAIVESDRRGVDYGHGKGDIEESSQHVFAVEVGRQYIEAKYVQYPDSPVIDVVPNYNVSGENRSMLPADAVMGGDTSDLHETADEYDQRRLDIAELDEDGEIRVTVEVERINNDRHRAIPDDFDKMADCDPDEAIWIVMTRQGGHEVLTALNDPLEGDPRVEKTYSENTPPQQFRIDSPGLTAIYPVEYVRDTLLTG